jgi:hypothetical protein
LSIDFNHHDSNLVADRNDIFWACNLIVGQLRCTHQTFFARQNFDEAAEVHDATYGACIDVS